MSRRGDCWDNTPAESFFARLKKDLVHGEDYATREEARASIFECVEGFYNSVCEGTRPWGASPHRSTSASITEPTANRHPLSVRELHLTGRALEMAVARRRPAPGLLVHSDRGCQYTSAEYRVAASGHGVALSYSRKGNCWDNAPMESFFASLKRELVYRESFATRAAVERSIFEYVEVFYNRVRLHSALGHLAPATFESLQP